MAVLEVCPPRGRRGVRILNPLPGGSSWTNRKKARAYCRRGHARMVGGQLEFIRHPAGQRKAHGPRLEVIEAPVRDQYWIDLRTFTDFLNPEVYGYPALAA